MAIDVAAAEPATVEDLLLRMLMLKRSSPPHAGHGPAHSVDVTRFSLAPMRPATSAMSAARAWARRPSSERDRIVRPSVIGETL